ncbi:MAG: DUF4252 domain-containing protein [Bacteroidales bacterium]|nr:DUF4252 domain-containing protein [Bacteroidales bacterium]
MKTICTTLLFLFGTVTISLAQKSYDDIVKQFASQPRAEYVRLGSFALKLARVFASREEAAFMRGIRSINVLSLDECDPQVKEAFRREALLLSESGLELLAEVAENQDHVRVFADIHNDKIRNFVVVSVGENPSLIQIKGLIDLAYMEKLVSDNT